MHGSVREWCHDSYAVDYYSNSRHESIGPSSDLHACTGGNWQWPGCKSLAFRSDSARSIVATRWFRVVRESASLPTRVQGRARRLDVDRSGSTAPITDDSRRQELLRAIGADQSAWPGGKIGSGSTNRTISSSIYMIARSSRFSATRGMRLHWLNLRDCKEVIDLRPQEYRSPFGSLELSQFDKPEAVKGSPGGVAFSNVWTSALTVCR